MVVVVGMSLLLGCGAPAGQKSAGFNTNAPLPHLACLFCLRSLKVILQLCIVALIMALTVLMNKQYMTHSEQQRNDEQKRSRNI